MDKPTPDAQHAQYSAMLSTWKMCRDCVAGQRAVHAAGETYLPKLSGQSKADYDSYRRRALFMNAVGRTVEGMTGLVFRRYPNIKLPEAIKLYETDINMGGVSLNGLAQEVVDEVLTVGRIGVLVEYPTPAPLPEGVTRTIEQSRIEGLRPYITTYKAEAIINWRYGRVANRTKLVNVFLAEADESDASKQQIRELFLENGAYGQRIWKEGQSGWTVVSEQFPKSNGGPISDIPFWVCQPKEGNADVQSPPIEDLAYVNIAHYMNSADLENGAHVAGLPTPVVAGVDGENIVELHLGSTTVIQLPMGATATFLQCGGEGFATLEKAMDRKEAQMAALGARMLAPEKKTSETADSLEAKRGGENSVLSALAGSADMVLSSALRFMAEWVGADPKEVFIELNKRYLPTPMDATMLTAWVKAWQSNAISYETFFAGLQRGELVPESISAEEEQDDIEAQAPVVDDGDA